MNLSKYDNKIVRVKDKYGNTFTGVADSYSPDYNWHEYGIEEEAVRIGDFVIFENDIEKLEELPNLKIVRATETWQQAGAYYVRIQAMAKKHQITLRQEFDEHDGPDTMYIVVTDADFPIGTARLYPLDEKSMMIGRVVVLPEYRHQGIGSMVIDACECWAEELGFEKIVVDSRGNRVGFYERLLYEVVGEPVDGETFRCIRMEKEL